MLNLVPGAEIPKFTMQDLKNLFFLVGTKYFPIHLNSQMYKQKNKKQVIPKDYSWKQKEAGLILSWHVGIAGGVN